MLSFFDRWLQRLTDNPLQRRNIRWMITAGLLSTAGSVLVFGPVFQTYLVKAGLTKGQIGLHGSAMQIAHAIGMLALMGLADRVRRRVRTVVICALIAGLTPAVLAVLTLLGPDLQTPTIVFVVIVLLGVVEQLVGSLRGMVHSGLMVRIIHAGLRGRLTGISGLTSGLVGMGLGMVVSRILGLTGFPRGFTICFGAATPLYILAAFSHGNLTELPELERPGRSGSAFPWAAISDVLKLREFRMLLGPNTLRGLDSGVFYFAWIVGLQRLDLPASYVGLAAMAQAISGTILGSMALGLCSDRWGPGRVVFGGDLLAAVALAGMVLTDSPPVFLAFYALAAFGGTLEGAGVPLGTYEIVPPEVMGAFSGARLMLLSVGGAISVALVGRFLESFDPLPVFMAGAVLKLITGVWYWYGFRRDGQGDKGTGRQGDKETEGRRDRQEEYGDGSDLSGSGRDDQ